MNYKYFIADIVAIKAHVLPDLIELTNIYAHTLINIQVTTYTFCIVNTLYDIISKCNLKKKKSYITADVNSILCNCKTKIKYIQICIFIRAKIF